MTRGIPKTANGGDLRVARRTANGRRSSFAGEERLSRGRKVDGAVRYLEWQYGSIAVWQNARM